MGNWKFVRENMLKNDDVAAAYKEKQTAMDIAKAIMTIRLFNGWTQKDLARQAKVSQADISRYENMEKLPNMATLKKLAEAGGYVVRISLEQIDPNEVKKADGAFDFEADDIFPSDDELVSAED